MSVRGILVRMFQNNRSSVRKKRDVFVHSPRASGLVSFASETVGSGRKMRAIRTTAVEIPMAPTLDTGAQAMGSTPLVPIDLETAECSPEGHIWSAPSGWSLA
jgi:hypothetical protein